MLEKDISEEQLRKIGIQLRVLRKEYYKCGYIEFADKVDMDKKTYYNLEIARKDYTIRNLLKVLAMYPEISLSDFFKRAGL